MTKYEAGILLAIAAPWCSVVAIVVAVANGWLLLACLLVLANLVMAGAAVAFVWRA